DLLDEADQRRQLVTSRRRRPPAMRERLVLTSAHTGQGLDDFIGLLRRLERAKYQVRHTLLAHKEGEALNWIYQRGDILSRHDDEHGIAITVSMDPVDIDRFAARFPHITLLDLPTPNSEG
ncbi:MAG: hypothetical protein AAF213_10540, partial [Pseudomonadota bacterium]